MKNLKIIFSFVVIFVIALSCIACNMFFSVSREEIKRVKSPDSKVDAVLIRKNGGATTPFGYMLYLVPAGGSPKKGNEIMRAISVDGLEIYWKESKFLVIKYKTAKILHFENFWYKDVTDYKSIFEIRLMPTNPSFSLDYKD